MIERWIRLRVVCKMHGCCGCTRTRAAKGLQLVVLLLFPALWEEDKSSCYMVQEIELQQTRDSGIKIADSEPDHAHLPFSAPPALQPRKGRRTHEDLHVG